MQNQNFSSRSAWSTNPSLLRLWELPRGIRWQLRGWLREVTLSTTRRSELPCDVRLGASTLRREIMRIFDLVREAVLVPRKIDRIIHNQGLILEALASDNQVLERIPSSRLFGQWNEDLMLTGIVDRLGLQLDQQTFIEFGVEDFFESNCRFLLQSRNWRGFVLDGNKKNIERFKRSDLHWRHDVQAYATFLNTSNVAETLLESGFGFEPGVISIDLDGVDYWILHELAEFRPIVYVVEFNAVFGLERSISIPYREDFHRTKAHFSNLYWGASLPSFFNILSERGYSLVQINDAFSNAFFVRDDYLSKQFSALSVSSLEGRTSLYRESRDSRGNLNFLSGEEKLDAIRGLPVINTLTGAIENL